MMSKMYPRAESVLYVAALPQHWMPVPHHPAGPLAPYPSMAAPGLAAVGQALPPVWELS